MKETNKTERIELRLNLADKERIERYAKRCGVSLSSYVRKCCIDRAPKAKPPDKFWKLLDRVYALYDTAPAETKAEIENLILALQEVM